MGSEISSLSSLSDHGVEIDSLVKTTRFCLPQRSEGRESKEEERANEQDWNRTPLDWRVMSSGLSLECICRNKECPWSTIPRFLRRTTEKVIIVNIGFPQNGEFFDVYDVLSQLICPKCESKIERNEDIRRWGFSRCTYSFKSIESTRQNRQTVESTEIFECGDSATWIQGGEEKTYVRLHLFVSRLKYKRNRGFDIEDELDSLEETESDFGE